jgi:cytochrome c553
MRPLLLVVLVGCANVAAEPAPGKRFERDMMLRLHMHENFGLLRTMEKLLVHGKLEEAQFLAQAMSQAPDVPGLGAWATETARTRDRAAAIAKAKTNDDALRAEVGLAEACAGCHVASNARPELPPTPALPADTATVGSRMARHLWATDRLWEGMVDGDDEAWRAGLDVLAGSPLPASELGSDRVAIAHRLQRLAREARTRTGDTDVTARARAYGDILVTCAACHAQRPANEAKR